MSAFRVTFADGKLVPLPWRDLAPWGWFPIVDVDAWGWWDMAVLAGAAVHKEHSPGLWLPQALGPLHKAIARALPVPLMVSATLYAQGAEGFLPVALSLLPVGGPAAVGALIERLDDLRPELLKLVPNRVGA